MDGNVEAFVDTPKAGIRLVLANPQLLYFDTNWYEESYQGIVALKLQGIVLSSTMDFVQVVLQVVPTWQI